MIVGADHDARVRPQNQLCEHVLVVHQVEERELGVGARRRQHLEERFVVAIGRIAVARRGIVSDPQPRLRRNARELIAGLHGVGPRGVVERAPLAALPDRPEEPVDHARTVAPVLEVEIEEPQVGRRCVGEREALRGERQARQRHPIELAIRAHLEAAARRSKPDRRRVPGGLVVREQAAVEAPRHVGEVERADQPLVDPSPLQERERRVAGHRLGAVSVLEPSELRGESAPAQRHEALLQERLSLGSVPRVLEIERSRA